MAIQTLVLGSAPEGVGGDSLRATATKLNNNFTSTENAASKLIGFNNGQIPLAQDITKALYTPIQSVGTLLSNTDTLSDKLEGDVYYINNNAIGAEDFSYGLFWTELAHGSARRVQVFKSVLNLEDHYIRQETARNSKAYKAWIKYAFHGDNYTAASVKAGAASYKRGWRKLTGQFGVGENTVYINKGTNQMSLTQVRVKLSSNIVVLPSDERPAFTYRVTENLNQQRVEIKKLASATALDNAEIHVYIDEEL